MRVSSLFVACAVASTLAACGGGGADGGVDPQVELLTESVPSGLTGQAYQVTLEAFFAHPPGRFIKSGGLIPPGLELDQVTGEISGFPRVEGSYLFEIEARDGADPTVPRDVTFAADRQRFTLVIGKGAPNFIPPFTLPPAQYHGSYAHVFDVAGGTKPYFFEFAGGELPDGLSVSSDGILGNFPDEARPEPYLFQVRVTDADGNSDVESFSVQVVVLPLVVGTTTIPQAAEDFPYSFQFEIASPGAGAPYTWTQVPPVAGETLLSSIGMELTSSGVLRNAAGFPGPTTAGSFDFKVQVTDEAGQVAPVPQRTFRLVVNPGPVLAKITPDKAAAGGPYVATGLNFQNGATLTFGAGLPNEQTITTQFISATELRFSSPPTLSGASGYVAVRVTNPDNGQHTKPSAFAYPAQSLDFENAARAPSPNSALSSTGVDVADVNADGFADIVHCGTTSFWSNASGTNGGLEVLVNAPPGGVFDPNNPVFTKVTLSTSDFHQVKFSDQNLDGKPDIVSVGNFGLGTEVRVYLNQFVAGTTPAFSAGMPFTQSLLPVQSFNTGNLSDMALGRMNASDQIPDLAFVYQEFPFLVSSFNSYYGSTYEENGGSVTTVRGLGGGAFATTELKTADAIKGLFSAAGVSAGRFNSDTLDDLHVSDQSNAHSTWYWGSGVPGTQGVAAMTDSGGLFGNWTPLVHSPAFEVELAESLGTAAGDVNGDGIEDVVVATGRGMLGGAANGWGDPALTTFAGTGTGSFTELPTYKPTGIVYRYDTVFDADFDLALDVAVTGGATGSFNRVDVLKGRTGNSGLQFREQVAASIGTPNIGRVATGDLNGDGKADVVVCLSFFADALTVQYHGASEYQDRGNGSTLGVAFFLNTSN
jgi:hypothetical protein